MLKLIKNHWILIFSLTTLWTSILVFLHISIENNNGYFCYPLDDIYIHLSIAKNFILHSVWGVDRYAFESATSSPLWTLMISGTYVVFGINEYSPLILNIIFASILIYFAYFILNKYNISKFVIQSTLFVIIFFTPLIPIICLGMEHVLHSLLTLLIVFNFSEMILAKNNRYQSNLILFSLSIIISSVRYEGLFLIFVICILLLIKKRFVYSFLLGFLSILPTIIYGIISKMNGCFMLPNSVLLKGNTQTNISQTVNLLLNINNLHFTIILLITLILLFIKIRLNKSIWEKQTILIVIFLSISFLHLLFAKLGWVYRYEGYLMILGFISIAIVTDGILSTIKIKTEKQKIIKLIIFVTFILISTPLVIRGCFSLVKTSKGIKNIYEQQYQMGLFLKSHYTGKGIAANDVGAINFLADIRCLDLWGLSSIDIAKAKISQTYNTEFINQISKKKDIEIAIIYSDWLNNYGGVPKSWQKVSDWTIPDNVICGDKTVSFYAVKTEAKDSLLQNLKTFSSKLPNNVIKKYYVEKK
jgi:hypothetical protein